MINRLDRQPGNHLVVRLDYLRKALDSLKTAQTFGASNVRMYQIGRGSLYGDSFLASVSTTTPRCVEVTLTPNSAVSNPVIAYDNAVTLSLSGGAGLYVRCDPQVPVSGVQKFRFYFLSPDITKDVNVGFTFWTISAATYTCQEVTP